MGLREKKAQRSRDRIITDAMSLFSQNGYEETTMEAIAEAADVSPSTLYRYFPSKDSIVLASFTGNTAKFAEVFAARAKEMSTERALAEAIFAVLAVEDQNPKHALLVRSILGQSPAARARLWDYLGEQQHQLATQLAACVGRSPDDPSLILTARVALQVLLAAADIWRSGAEKLSSHETVVNLMRLLRGGEVLFPDPGPPAPDSKTATTIARRAAKRTPKR